jgi:hypothetical protein
MQLEPIAIIGIGCRFPGAENPQAFWSMIRLKLILIVLFYKFLMLFIPL